MKERLYMRFLKLHITYPLITLILCTTQNLNTVLLYLERLLRTDAPTLYTFPNSIGASKLLRTHLDTRNKLSPISIQPPNVRFLRLLDKRFIQSLVIYPIQLTLYCLYSFRTRTASCTFLCKRKTHSNRLLNRYISDVSYEIYNTLRLWVKVTYGPY